MNSNSWSVHQLFGLLDQNQDGKITADEIPESQLSFFRRALRVADRNEDGKLTNEGQYLNNEMSGTWKRWYDTGELQEEVTFAANLENGPFKEYHKNGKLKAEGNYLEGDNEQGELKEYDENGELVKRMYCEFGVCMDAWTKEKGDVAIDTARIKKLAELKRQAQ